MERCKTSVLSVASCDYVVAHVCSLALAAISQVTYDIFYSLTRDRNVPNALFQTSSRNVSETFPLEVTMDWWSEIYWIMIGFWSHACLAYAMVSLFRRNALGPLCCNHEIHPPVFYLMWTINNIVKIWTMSLWDSHDFLGVVFLRWLVPILSFYMLSISCSNLDTYKSWLAINNPSVIPWTRYLVQNGLAVFAWWSLLDAAVGLGMVFKYKQGVPDPLVSTGVLTVISLCSITWFILENFLLTRYLRHTFSVYPLLILSLGAMFTRSYRVHDLSANTIYCGFLMLLMTVMSLVHLILSCVYTDKSRHPAAAELGAKPEVCVTVCRPEGRQLYE